MEKLKPLLIHRFWILFGLAVLLPPIGWGLASSALNKQIEERTSKLERVFKEIPDGTSSPNQKWVDEVTNSNRTCQQLNQESHVRLWNKQKELMYWPEAISDIMARCPYRGKITETGVAENVPVYYVNRYSEQLQVLWGIVEPLDDSKGNMTDLSENRKIKLELASIPSAPVQRWVQLSPTWPEIWDAQEDVWLSRALLEAIARVNLDTSTILESHVKRIEQIQLFGGVRGQPKQTTRRKRAGEEFVSDEMRGMMEAALQGGSSRNVDFLSEEFQEVHFLRSNSSMGAMRMPAGIPMDMRSTGGMSTGMMDMTDTGASGALQQKKKKNTRYVDDSKDLPYRTRGFRIKLTLDHQQIPTILAELSKSPWPIEIVRVHYVTGTGLSSDVGAASEMLEANRAMETAMAKAAMDMAGDFGNTGGRSGSSDVFLQNKRRQQAVAMAKVALTDPNIASVEIAGLMTLYNPPKEKAKAEGAPSRQADAVATITGDSEIVPRGDARAGTVNPNPDVQIPQTPAVTTDMPPETSKLVISQPDASDQVRDVPNITPNPVVPGEKPFGTTIPNKENAVPNDKVNHGN